MKSKRLMALALLAGALTVCGPLLAHHGAAAYEDKIVVLKDATVTKFVWSNPHNIVMFDVKDDKGNVVHWSCEAGAPGALSRRGFKRADIKEGDTLIVDGYLAKDGSHLIDARRVILPDGRVVGGGSAGDGGPGDNGNQ